MTKFYIYNDVEFNYDELERNDIYLFSAPDDFVFNAHLVERFLKSKGLECHVSKELPWEVVVSGLGYYTLEWLLNPRSFCKKSNIIKGEFIEWLKTLGVSQVPYGFI